MRVDHKDKHEDYCSTQKGCYYCSDWCKGCERWVKLETTSPMFEFCPTCLEGLSFAYFCETCEYEWKGMGLQTKCVDCGSIYISTDYNHENQLIVNKQQNERGTT